MQNNDLKQEFLSIYSEVFDENNNIKFCGRVKTTKLINIAAKINKDIDFGNVHTGIMNVDNIKNLYNEIH